MNHEAWENVMLVLDRLDDNSAIYKGLETVDVTVPTPFGDARGAAQYPALCIDRIAWEDLGTPTMLSISIRVPDRAPNDSDN